MANNGCLTKYARELLAGRAVSLSMDGYSVSEIADILCVSEATVRKWFETTKVIEVYGQAKKRK